MRLDLRVSNYDELEAAWKENGLRDQDLPSEDALMEEFRETANEEGYERYGVRIVFPAEKEGERVVVYLSFDMQMDYRETIFTFRELEADIGRRRL